MKKKFLFYTFFLIFFFLTFNFIFITLRSFFTNGILFYQGLIAIVLTSLIFIPVFFKKNNFLEMFGYFLFSMMFCYSFLITVPALLDRSISLYILATVYKKEKISESEINDYFINGFIKKNKAVNKRLEEQIFTKNISKNGKIYEITKNGILIHNLNIMLSNLYKTDKNYLSPSK
jgi:hypothetical protein